MVNEHILASMGGRHHEALTQSADTFKVRITNDPDDVEAHLGLAETNILAFIFGFEYRKDTLPAAKRAIERAIELNPTNAEVSRLTGVAHFLDWDWRAAEASFTETFRRDPRNLNARHWYSLFLVAMGRFEEAMAQSDELLAMDDAGDYLLGRASLLYFQHRFAEMKDILNETIARDPSVPWGYDWLGMAYNGLEEHGDALAAYKTAFELSEGTAEVGAGYAHALGLAGYADAARQIADHYAAVARERYVPPVQRAYIHIGLGEHDEALRLLEQASEETSWFLAFMKVEPWLDPLRDDARFADLQRSMGFPV